MNVKNIRYTIEIEYADLVTTPLPCTAERNIPRSRIEPGPRKIHIVQVEAHNISMLVHRVESCYIGGDGKPAVLLRILKEEVLEGY